VITAQRHKVNSLIASKGTIHRHRTFSHLLRDVHLACGVVATVEDGRLAKVNADPAHPNGCICVKGTAAPEIVYSPDRLRTPMRRRRSN